MTLLHAPWQPGPRSDHLVKEVHQLMSVRALLEAHAADEAARFAAEEGALLELERLAASPHPDAGRRFHVALAVCAGNGVIVNMLDGVFERLATLVGVGWSCGGRTEAQSAHRALCEAVKGGRSSDAAALAKAHVHASQLAIVDMLSSPHTPVAPVRAVTLVRTAP